MKLIVNRFVREEWTDGILYTDGIMFCDTLEDPVRDYNKDGDLNDEGEEKIYGDTAVPYGIYGVQLTWSPKFKGFYPRVMNVNHFSGILIHGGVTKEHTHGCLLVGKRILPGRLIEGRETSQRLLNFLIHMCAEKGKENKPVIITDNDYGKKYKLKEPITIQYI